MRWSTPQGSAEAFAGLAAPPLADADGTTPPAGADGTTPPADADGTAFSD
ncbi:hypothetical protein [Catenuloplanes japonicus]|nr:hypothetical protein [Catenuloplanes japonicus]